MTDAPKLILGDCRDALVAIDEASVDLVLTDVPYGMDVDDWDILHKNSNSALGGSSPSQVRLGSGFARRGKPINGWSKADRGRPLEYQQWCDQWTKPLLRTMKPGASAFIFCGRRTIHRVMVSLEESDFLVRDMLCWRKPNAHHRAQNLSKVLDRQGKHKDAREWDGWRLGNLAPYFEPIVWAFRPYALGETITDNVLRHRVGAMNVADCLQDGHSPGNILDFGFVKNERKYHTAQKPVSILEYLIRLTTRKGQMVLDPFAGSGSTGVAAVHLQRRCILIERNREYIETARRRVSARETEQ